MPFPRGRVIAAGAAPASPNHPRPPEPGERRRNMMAVVVLPSKSGKVTVFDPGMGTCPVKLAFFVSFMFQRFGFELSKAPPPNGVKTLLFLGPRDNRN